MRSMALCALALSLCTLGLFGASVAAQEATPGAAVAPGAASPAAGAAASPVAAAPATALFVQAFTVGKLEPGAEAGTATLTLQGPDGETVYFGDQPGRFAGAVAFDNFVQILGQAAGTPLPAAVVIDRPEGDQVVAFELTEGTVDASGTLTYTVQLTDPSTLSTDLTQSAAPLTDVTAALDFGPSHLFVDASQ